MSRISARKQTTIAALVIFCLIPFIRLGEGDLQSDEVMYASRAQSVASSNNLFPETPLRAFFGGQPPLVVWGMALAVKIFGFSSFSARLVSAISAAILVLVIYWLALLIVPPVYALGAAALLASSSLFLHFSQMAQLDVPWVMFIVVAFTLFWYSRELEKRSLFVLSAIFFGLSFVAKLLVSVIPLGAFLLWMILESRRENATIRIKEMIQFAAIIAIVALPWHLWMFAHYGAEAYEVMVQWNVLNRVTQGAESAVKATGRLFYLNQLAVGFPLCVVVLVFFFYRTVQIVRTRSLQAIQSLELFFWLWLLVPLIALSIVKAEMQSYSVQLLPPLALLAMLGVMELSLADIGKWWRPAVLIGIAAMCAWGFSQVVRDGAREFFAPGSARAPVSDTPFMIAVSVVVVCAVLIVLLSLQKKNTLKNIFLLLPTWGVALLVGVRVVVAAAETTEMRTTGAQQVAMALPASAHVAIITGSRSEEDTRMQFHCYDASKTLYQRLMLFSRDSFAQTPVLFPDSIRFVVLENPDPYFFNDNSGRRSEANLLAQQYVVLLQLPKYELFARGLARDLIRPHHE